MSQLEACETTTNCEYNEFLDFVHWVTLLLINPESVWRWVEVRDIVKEITEEGVEAYIDALAKRYLGVDRFPFRQPGQMRVMYKIKPNCVNAVDSRR